MASKLGSASRFKARYGSSLKKIFAKIESKYKNKKLKCPHCHKLGVKRLAAGIWNCTKCNTKFAGRAYEL
jgi:large subunit ribosomal protein L37Ae